MGITLAYVGLLVLLPLAALALKSLGIGPREFWTTVTAPRTLHALKLSFAGALIAAGINAVFGLLTA